MYVQTFANLHAHTHAHTHTWLAVAPCACQLLFVSRHSFTFALRNASAASVQIHTHMRARLCMCMCVCMCVCVRACVCMKFVHPCCIEMRARELERERECTECRAYGRSLYFKLFARSLAAAALAAAAAGAGAAIYQEVATFLYVQCMWKKKIISNNCKIANENATCQCHGNTRTCTDTVHSVCM